MRKLFINLAGSPFLWGLVATFLFYFAINSGLIRNETIVRYSTGHPVEYATIAMFWVGVFDLTFKTIRTRRERLALKRGALFPPKKRQKEPIELVDEYLDTIAKARAVRGNTVYLTRLADALNFLKFGGCPDDLDQELRFLADDAYDARDSEYGMVRTFIWAIPILGFLGTVLGITVALGSLDLTQLETTGEMLASGLKIAFDTTALALSLVFVLYFAQFFSRRQDAELESSVSRLVDSELRGRFCSVSLAADSELDTARRFMQSVAQSFAEATHAQTTMWAQTMSQTASQFGDSIDRRLTDGSAMWAQALARTQQEFIERTIQPALEETAKRAERLDSLEDKVALQTAALNEALRAAADLTALEDRFARSLEKIAEVGEFEKTLNNLSATVCLLNSKLTSTVTQAPSSETVRFDAGVSRRVSKRNEALAALESLENALEASAEAEPKTILMPKLDEESNESEEPEKQEAIPMPAPEEPKSDPEENADEKKPRVSLRKKRSA
jgi:biopolymer transport protein ExbB/TolQ